LKLKIKQILKLKHKKILKLLTKQLTKQFLKIKPFLIQMLHLVNTTQLLLLFENNIKNRATYPYLYKEATRIEHPFPRVSADASETT